MSHNFLYSMWRNLRRKLNYLPSLHKTVKNYNGTIKSRNKNICLIVYAFCNYLPRQTISALAAVKYLILPKDVWTSQTKKLKMIIHEILCIILWKRILLTRKQINNVSLNGVNSRKNWRGDNLISKAFKIQCYVKLKRWQWLSQENLKKCISTKWKSVLFMTTSCRYLLRYYLLFRAQK